MSGSIKSNVIALPLKKTFIITDDRSNDDIFSIVLEDILYDWKKYSAKNTLHEYVKSKLFGYVKTADNMFELDVLSTLQSKLNMYIELYCAEEKGIRSYNEFIAAFWLGNKLYCTPKMESESKARALSVILFLDFSKILKSMGRSINNF